MSGSPRGLHRAMATAAGAAWPLFQVTLAATAAWAVALRIAGHTDPFFAPVAAVVALNAPRGERGAQAVRLLLGVTCGIVTGEVTVALMGGGFGRLALACFASMIVARAAGAARIVIVQAGVSAILTVVAADGEAGVHRLIDAAIGGGVAMVFSQLLFSPEPVALLRRAETLVLARIARGLDATATALESADEKLAGSALASLRGARDDLAELARLRTVSHNVARHSAVWQSQRTPLVRERENADHLDLLGSACVMLARMAFSARDDDQRMLAPHVRKLSDILEEIADHAGDQAVRQRAADHTLAGLRELAAATSESDSERAAVIVILRMLATDVLVFAGADPDEARAAVRSGTGDFDVAAPPPTPRLPFDIERRNPLRRDRRSAVLASYALAFGVALLAGGWYGRRGPGPFWSGRTAVTRPRDPRVIRTPAFKSQLRSGPCPD